MSTECHVFFFLPFKIFLLDSAALSIIPLRPRHWIYLNLNLRKLLVLLLSYIFRSLRKRHNLNTPNTLEISTRYFKSNGDKGEYNVKASRSNVVSWGAKVYTTQDEVSRTFLSLPVNPYPANVEYRVSS